MLENIVKLESSHKGLSKKWAKKLALAIGVPALAIGIDYLWVTQAIEVYGFTEEGWGNFKWEQWSNIPKWEWGKSDIGIGNLVLAK